MSNKYVIVFSEVGHFRVCNCSVIIGGYIISAYNNCQMISIYLC